MRSRAARFESTASVVRDSQSIPPAIVKATLKRYGKSAAVTELEQFPDRGHSLTIDSGWRSVADRVLAWLERKSL
jgi:non-heme chloroperoxidase